MTFNFSCIYKWITFNSTNSHTEMRDHLFPLGYVLKTSNSICTFDSCFMFHLLGERTQHAAHKNLLIKWTYSWLNVAIIICECSNIDAISITNERLQQLLYPQQLMKIAGFMRFEIHCHRDSPHGIIQYVSLPLD